MEVTEWDEGRVFGEFVFELAGGLYYARMNMAGKITVTDRALMPVGAFVAIEVAITVYMYLKSGRGPLELADALVRCPVDSAAMNPVYAGHGEGMPYATGIFRCPSCPTEISLIGARS